MDRMLAPARPPSKYVCIYIYIPVYTVYIPVYAMAYMAYMVYMVYMWHTLVYIQHTLVCKTRAYTYTNKPEVASAQGGGGARGDEQDAPPGLARRVGYSAHEPKSRQGPGTTKTLYGLLPERQGRNLAVTVLYVPHSLYSGRVGHTAHAPSPRQGPGTKRLQMMKMGLQL